MTKPLRTTGIVFLTMLLVLLSLMVPVHAEDQKAAGAGTAGTAKESIYDNNYDMGKWTPDNFSVGTIWIVTDDDSVILDKSTIVGGSELVDNVTGHHYMQYCLRLSSPEEAYKAFGYYAPKVRAIATGNTAFAYSKLIQDISFDSNGGAGQMSKQTIKTFIEGVRYGGGALNKNTFTRDGYTFAGWNTKADGTGKAYKDGAKVYNVGDLANNRPVLYAQWTPDKYTVRYHANGGTGQMVNQEMVYGTEEALITKGFTRDGYTFKGWNTKADGSGTAYGDKEVVKDLTSENGGTVDLYAQWSKDNSGALSEFVGPKTGDDNGIGRDILILAAACTLVIVLRVKRAKGISE